MISTPEFIGDFSKRMIDVRSPSEFQEGHIPGAVNIPLFDDEERHLVGLTYKEKGRDAAVKLGLTFVGPKLRSLVESAEQHSTSEPVHVYCWRGGMRSQSVAWLLNTSGIKAETLGGGYKSWRRFIHKLFESDLPLITMGGFTGCSKTEILHHLKISGEQILDLENLASHKGSAFGNVGNQPKTEHFENLLGRALLNLDLNTAIWIEDESKIIGSVSIPTPIKNSMNRAPFVFIRRNQEERVQFLCTDYGTESIEELKSGFQRIRKKLGGQALNDALESLDQGDLAPACAIALKYYDKSYTHSLLRSGRVPMLDLDISGQPTSDVAQNLIQWKKQDLRSTAMARVADAK